MNDQLAQKSIRQKSIQDLSPKALAIAAIVAFIFGVIVFSIFPLGLVDWRHSFLPVARIPLQPYSIKTFVNPPWTALILYPLHFFSENLSGAINGSLNLVVFGLLVIKRKGTVLPFILTLTSLPFMMLIFTGSIEWIPALAFIMENKWGIPFLLTKPQSGIIAAWKWFISSKQKIVFLLPSVFIILASFLVWKNWPVLLMQNVKYMSDAQIGLFTVSISPFPYSIPIGLGLIFYILKYAPKDAEIFGVAATLCLVPYYYVHSLTILFALVAASHRRIGIVLWVLLWLLPVVLGLTR